MRLRVRLDVSYANGQVLTSNINPVCRLASGQTISSTIHEPDKPTLIQSMRQVHIGRGRRAAAARCALGDVCLHVDQREYTYYHVQLSQRKG